MTRTWGLIFLHYKLLVGGIQASNFRDCIVPVCGIRPNGKPVLHGTPKWKKKISPG